MKGRISKIKEKILNELIRSKRWAESRRSERERGKRGKEGMDWERERGKTGKGGEKQGREGVIMRDGEKQERGRGERDG